MNADRKPEETRRKPWENGPLHPAPDRPYLLTGEKPFFWMGDTAWLMVQKLKAPEVERYLRNRAEKGFNVVQTSIYHWHEDTNAYGAHAFVDMDMAKPCLLGEFTYWDMLDRIVETAERYGIYMALLPHWGGVYRDRQISMEQGAAYTAFLAERYRDAPNIIWVTGGDVRGDEGYDYWSQMGRILKERNPDKLVCYHPFGRTTSIDYFPCEEWLDLHMFQSGHSRYDQWEQDEIVDRGLDTYRFGEDNWRYVRRVYEMTGGGKPVLDAEPSYENIPQGLLSAAEPLWRDDACRRYAYWSVFAGGCGFTYGHNAIMQMADDPRRAGSYNCWESWKEAIHHPGGDSMSYLALLMSEVDFSRGREAEAALACPQGTGYERIAIFGGEDYLLCYRYLPGKIALKKGCLAGRVEAWWMNPLTGVRSYAGETDFTQERSFVTPAKEYMPNRDWVLILRKKDGENRAISKDSFHDGGNAL